MVKKGQISLFVIVGIVLLAVFGLVFYYRDLVAEKVLGVNILSNQLEFVSKNIENCIASKTKISLDKLAKQGGTLNQINYFTYMGKKITYLCDAPLSPEKGCINHMFLISDVEKELTDSLKSDIKTCIDSNLNSDKFVVTKDNNAFVLTTTVERNDVLFNVIYPLKLTRGETSVDLKEFSKKVDVPLGRIALVVNDILNSEAIKVNFASDLYVRAYPYANIRVLTLSENKIYTVKDINNDQFEFIFGVGR